MKISCNSCNQTMRVECPSCFEIVSVKWGKHNGLPCQVYSGHDRTVNLGTHLEYKTCPQSSKPWENPSRELRLEEALRKVRAWDMFNPGKGVPYPVADGRYFVELIDEALK